MLLMSQPKNSQDERSLDKNNRPDEIIKTVSNITLEQFAVDVTNVMEMLKNNFKDKLDTLSDVEPQLEKLCEERKVTKQEQEKKKQEKPVKNKKPSTTSALLPKKPNQQQKKPEQNKDNKSIAQISHVPLSKEYYNPYAIIKEEVKRAIKERKTFTIKGRYPEIRRALLKRGWIEKLHPSNRNVFKKEMNNLFVYTVTELLQLIRNKNLTDMCRRMIQSKLLEEQNHQVDFYWSYNYDVYKEISDKVKMTKVNKLRRKDFSFTTKKGVCDAARESFLNPVQGRILNHPRTYSLIKNGDTKGFVNDFYITAAMSLLKWVHHNSISMECKILSPSGKIPIGMFYFALTECYRFVKKAHGNEVDIPEAFEYEWNNFLQSFYRLVHVGNHFKKVDDVTEESMVRKCTYILDKLHEIWPFLDMDGLMNIWILKPVHSSQGVGIHMCRTLNYVLNVVKNNPNRRYVIQKYIERPLLIYNTKFDIRQWFLVSSTIPLTIWMYKQCYLRFSSQTYNLRKLHESIHLTNNSVQCKYNKNTSRDIALPSYNMWDSEQFKTYLSNIGYPKAFTDIIHPGMIQCIISTILLHQKGMDKRRNTFELYGADFIITEDFKPWLLEINASPALHASTPITARMCPQVLEDVIKVVVDFDRNPKASTGDFEMVYKGNMFLHVANNNKTEKKPDLNEELSDKPLLYTKNCKKTDPAVVKQISKGIKNTLESLLELLKKERLKRDNNQCVETTMSGSFWKDAERTVSVETVLSNATNETQTSENGSNFLV